MDGTRLGRLSLRLDALYCLLLGLIIAIAGRPIADAVALPCLL